MSGWGGRGYFFFFSIRLLHFGDFFLMLSFGGFRVGLFFALHLDFFFFLVEF